MPTIGETLHMDEEGRFTTAGAGPTVADEFERRAREEHKNDQVRLTDAEGRLCGYLTLSQVWALPESVAVEGDMARILEDVDAERRIALLRLSFSNRGMAPPQNAEVSTTIDGLLKHWSEPRMSGGETANAPKARHRVQASDAPMLVTRDARGMFLGVHSMEDATKRWPWVARHGEVLRVGSFVTFAKAYHAACGSKALPTVGTSRRLERSVADARRYLARMRRVSTSSWWGNSHTVGVFHKSWDPICTVPLSVVGKVFGDDWFVVSNDAVQLVGTFSKEDLATLVTIAEIASGQVELLRTAFRSGAVRVVKRSWSSSGPTEFEIVAKAGTTISRCTFDELVRFVGLGEATQIRHDEARRLADARAAAKKSHDRQHPTKPKRPKKSVGRGSAKSAAAQGEPGSPDGPRWRSAQKAERPSTRDLLRQAGATDEEVDEITRLANARLPGDPEGELERFARAGMRHARGEVTFTPEPTSARQVVNVATGSRGLVTTELRLMALSTILDGMRQIRKEGEHDGAQGPLRGAHMFVFDEDAYQAALSCEIPLERLPYRMCLVEDVLLTSHGDRIEGRALAKGASMEDAKRLMSFVVNCCTSGAPGGSKANYVSINEADSYGDGGQVARRAHARRGHWRNQPYGPKNSLRKRIWIDETLVSESCGIGKNDIRQVHRVSLRWDSGVGAINSIDL